jgi:hypothetical protein
MTESPRDAAWARAWEIYEAAKRAWLEMGCPFNCAPEFKWHPAGGARVRTTAGRIAAIRIRHEARSTGQHVPARSRQPRRRRTGSQARAASARADPDPGKDCAGSVDQSRPAHNDDGPRLTKTRGRAGCVAQFIALGKPLASPGRRGGAPCEP